MKGIITGIKRMAVHDGQGIRTTVFFKGCPLSCIWCHNPEGISFDREIAYYPHKCVNCGACTEVCDPKNGALPGGEGCTACGKCADACPSGARIIYGEEWESEQLAEKLLEDREFFENSGGGVTFSGGECLSQIDFATDLAKRLFEKGVSVDIDTSGCVSPSALERIIPYVDEFLYDIKAIDGELHKKLTGRDNKIILDNLRLLDDLGCKIEIRYPLVPGYNSGECEKIGEFLKTLKNTKRIKILGYHSLARSKYEAVRRKDTLPIKDATREDVERAKKLLSSFGLSAINGMDGD